MLASGSGIWLDGAVDAALHHNVVTANAYGIAIAGGAARRISVTGNTLLDNADADLAWDGVGTEVCFAGNSTPTGGTPTSDPPAVETLYPCGAPTVGVPYPIVLARLVARGLDSPGEPQ
jgi:hypothetical protein